MFIELQRVFFYFHVILYRNWRHFLCPSTKFKTLGLISLLIVTISTSVVLVINHYTPNNGDEVATTQGKVFIEI
jgi:hypothetical protein